jgi:PAS domain S-box-containing protein
MEPKRADQDSGTSVGQVPMDRLRTIFDGMFDGVWLVAADGRTTYANAAMAGLLGLAPSQMHGRPMTDFIDEGLWPDVEAFLARQRTVSGERMELRLRRADGSDLFGLVAGSPIYTLEGAFAGTMLNVSDMTGKRSIDAQIAQNQRLEAIGEFAGGIAHDFNNLLTAISGYAELARSRLPEGDPVRNDLDQVVAGAERATAITRKLLAFTRRQVLEPIVLDPAQLIADLFPLLKPLLGDDIDVIFHIDPKHGWVRADPGKLEQVFVNLAVNARDAMPAGGTLTLGVEDVTPSDPDRPDPDQTAPPSVRITVSDTGTGMDEETRTRVFDPFFTTKDLGRGTGLGLATVFGIVSQSGGQISVDSAPGKGATFTIDLPQVGVTNGSQVQPHAVAARHRGLGVVLLVEDDFAVREFARRVLEAAGFVVLNSGNGEEAIEANERWADGIDVLVTDIVMPGMHGPELAERLRVLRPGIGVVFMSGYAQDAIGGGGELGTFGAFLSKPFNRDALVRAVRGAVEAAQPEILQAS